MKQLKVTLAAGVLLAAGVTSSSAAVVSFSILAGSLQTAGGAALPSGSLVQLVNLGPDGVFNDIRGDDGNVTSLGQWVSGDDSLVNQAFGAADFSSAAAFDLTPGADPSNGVLQRGFNNMTLTTGDKLGIRWWPTVTAANFGSTTLSNNIAYGQFTRQGSTVYGGTYTTWVVPADAASETFDPLSTPNSGLGGTESESLGLANKQTIAFVPEPGSAMLLAAGAASLGLRRRRRA